jgi:hypothetical protein
MNGSTSPASAASPEAPWKRYPYAIAGADERWFSFPAAEGHQGLDANTWLLEARLRGLRSGRELAVLSIFSAMRIPIGFGRNLHADFFLLSLFDLASGAYATASELDLPRPLRLRRSHRLRAARGLLDVTFEARAGRSRWAVRRDAAGAPVPFSYALDLRARDRRGEMLAATLDVEVGKPPSPRGGDDARGIGTAFGQLGAFSYFQTGLAMHGKVRWGDFEDQVVGDVGWIDRQFARQHFGSRDDRRHRRHRHEWLVLHLDNGWDLGIWQRFDTARGDRLVPYSGVTAQGPNGEVRATTDFLVEPLSFVRDPREVQPLRPLARGAAWLTDRVHVTVRDWPLSVTAEPLVPAPAHRLPIEYWNGPVRVIGQMAGRPVSGVGFHERTKVWFRPEDLVFVLRETLRHLPATGQSGADAQALANRVWNCDVLLGHRDRAGTREYLEREVEPGLRLLPQPGRQAARPIYDALIRSLRWPARTS